MKLQFAFGNPRRKKRKSVANSRKKAKNKSVKKKSLKGLTMTKKRRSNKMRKNPEAAFIRRGKKVVGHVRSALNKKEYDALKKKLTGLKAKYSSLPLGAQKSATLKELNSMIRSAKSKIGSRDSYLKTLERDAKSGATINRYDIKEKGDKPVAKKKRKKKKASKKVAKKASGKVRRKKRRKSKKVRAKKVAKTKVRRTKKRKSKGSKRRRKKSKAVVVSAAPKKARRRKGKKRKSSKRRKRARMVTHKHASSTRHIKKGSSFRFKTKAKKGKRSITVSGRVKVNPFRRNPMKNLSAQTKKYLGIDAAEIGSLALGGVAVPVINGLAGKFAPGVVAKINEFVGPQAVGSVLPIIAGIMLNAAAEHVPQIKGQAKSSLKMVGEGLAAAGIIGLMIGLSSKYAAPALGLSGVNYTPMSGMGDVRYTPSMRGMGILPTLSGMGDVRYTPDMSGADFGSADYGGNAGYAQSHKSSRSDFGADFSQDSEADHFQDDENSLSSSMN